MNSSRDDEYVPKDLDPYSCTTTVEYLADSKDDLDIYAAKVYRAVHRLDADLEAGDATMIDDSIGTLEKLRQFINSNSLENGSNTPDFLLAAFLAKLLQEFDIAVKRRDEWYGVKLAPGSAHRVMLTASKVFDGAARGSHRLLEEDLVSALKLVDEFEGNWASLIIRGLVHEIRECWSYRADLEEKNASLSTQALILRSELDEQSHILHEVRMELAATNVDISVQKSCVATLRYAALSMECDCANPTRKDICPKCKISNFLKSVP